MTLALRMLAAGRSATRPMFVPIAPDTSATFRISANVGGVNDFAPEPTFVDLLKAFRGFGLTTDAYLNLAPRPTLDANGWPSQDFGITVPAVPFSATTQTLKCQLGGLATIATASASGFSIANQSVAGDVTTFDFVIAAGNTATNACQLIFTNTKRTAAGSTNTGCTGLVIKSPGYSIADATVFMPNFLALTARFYRLRMMDLTQTNGDLTTILTTDRPSDTHKVGKTISIEDACRMCNAANRNLWWNFPPAASDALVTAMATVVLNNLNPGLDCIFELGNENWNFSFSQHNYFMDLVFAQVNGWSAQFSTTRIIVSAVRASNVLTITFNIAHGISNGATVATNGLGSVTGSRVVTSVPGSTSITLADTGADGAVSLSGATSLVADFTTPFNSYDGCYDQFALQRRYYAKRATQMSVLVASVFGGAFGTTAKFGLFNQPANGQADQMLYVSTSIGSPSTYFQGMGEASYFFTNAAPFGGADLRNVSTYGGNTPPAIADYCNALALTSDGAKILDDYDRSALTARLYGLKLWQYEFGPDMTGSPVGTAGPTAGLQKIDSLFDPLFQPVYATLLANMEQHGFEEVCAYNIGATPAGSNSEYSSWGMVRSFTTPSVRTAAIDAALAATRTGLMRNVVSGTSAAVTTIDARLFDGRYSPTGAYPDLDAGLATQGKDWNITTRVAGVYSFVPTLQCLTNDTSAVLRVNGTIVTTYVLTHKGGTIVPAPVSITLTKGTNWVRFERGGPYLGNFAQAISLSFTAP